MSGAIELEEIDTEAFTDRYGKLAVSVAPQADGCRGGVAALHRHCEEHLRRSNPVLCASWIASLIGPAPAPTRWLAMTEN